MGDGFTFDVDMKPLDAAISRALARFNRPSDLMNAIGAKLESNMAQRFVNKVDPDGHAWLPLAPSTLRMKGGRGSILIGARGGADSLHAGIAYNAGDNWVEVGSSNGTKYSGYLETGTRRMPRRSWLLGDFMNGRLGYDDEADVLDAIDQFVSGSLF